MTPSLGEFTIIERFFARGPVQRQDVILGIGDDAALLRVPEGQTLATAMTTLRGIADRDPATLGHRALALPLSRLAALGATPAWATLALTLPDASPAWLLSFSTGLMALARRHQVQLVGGDTTRGPLAITVATSGLMPEGQELRRNGARPGDLIYVTGTLGEAGLAMLAQQKEIRLSRQDQEQAQRRLEQPEPRIPMGIAVRGLASAANDLPDGLAAGLGQILEASGTGATLYGERLPVAPGVRPWLATLGLGFPLAAGGDYELCFCVPPARQQAVEASLAGLTPACTWIGIVERAPGLRCLLSDGTDIGPG